MKHSSDARRFCGGLMAALGVCAVAVAGCGNPVIDSRIAALGDEDPNVAASEFHRAGQPCVLCHSEYEGASPELSVGGTVFATITDQIPVDQVKVTLTDALGETRVVPTNCVGNFYITKDEWTPAFPLQASITYNLPSAGMPMVKQRPMNSRISRDGSCATCHNGNRTQASVGWVFCEDKQPTPAFALVPGCAGTVPPPVPPPTP
jgi:hypothetical protein